LKDIGRVQYRSATDEEALAGVKLLSRTEGIIPALETAHAIAFLPELAASMRPDQLIVLNCSGRGDKDMGTISKYL
jgi:tryptophan synthase beta chain